VSPGRQEPTGESVDQSCAQFNRRALLEQGMSMSRYVEEAVRGRRAVHEVEAELFRRVLAMGDQALGMFFRQCGDGDERERVCLSNGRCLGRLQKPHARP